MDKGRFVFRKLYAKDKETRAVLPFDLKEYIPVPQPQNDVLLDWMKFYLKKEVVGVESKHTARAKAYDLHKLYVYFTKLTGHENIKLWDKATTASFIEALDKEYSVASTHRIFATVVNFVFFLILYEVIRPINNPVKDARFRSLELPAPQGITSSRDDVRLSSKKIYSLLMDAAQSLIDEKDPADKKNCKMPYRNAAIIALLYNTGLRADEVRSIQMSQMEPIREGGMWIRNIQCKGRKVCKACFKKAAVPIYNNYIDRERGEGAGFVFKSWRGNRLNQQDIWRICKSVALRAKSALPPGVTIKIHPHSFRHERGFNLKEAGLGDSMVAELLGHASTGQVARYSRRSEYDEEEILENI